VHIYTRTCQTVKGENSFYRSVLWMDETLLEGAKSWLVPPPIEWPLYPGCVLSERSRGRVTEGHEGRGREALKWGLGRGRAPYAENLWFLALKSSVLARFQSYFNVAARTAEWTPPAGGRKCRSMGGSQSSREGQIPNSPVNSHPGCPTLHVYEMHIPGIAYECIYNV